MDQWHRRYRDLCADCYNQWQKWQSLNVDAVSIARSLANDRILLLDPSASAAADVDFDFDLVQTRLLETCDKRVAPILEKFSRIAAKFEKIDLGVEALEKLRDLKMSEPKTNDGSKPNLDKLRKLVKLLRNISRDELKCKKAAFFDLPLATSRDATVFCVACFVHQPYMDETELTFLLEAIVLESGHKVD